MTSLNKQQHLASLPTNGISLVIAGAGTGKTKILVEKVKNIIHAGLVKPENILILTFSSKAALEIRERVMSGVSQNADAITSGTFHSFCLSLLRSNSGVFLSSFNFNEFPKILDEQEKEKLLSDLLRNSIDRFLGLPVNVVAGLFENIDRLNKKTYEKLMRLGIIDELDNLKRKFSEYKISYNMIDFSDMINFAIDLLTNDASIREDTTSKYKYILIDEFQDTSPDNLKLIRLLLDKKNPNLFLVGDDWQSIYGFRGSKIDYIVNMKKYFPDAGIYNLNLNYRSNKEIVKLSNNFIRKNKYRTWKKLKSVKGSGGLVVDFCVVDFDEEIEVIIDILKKNNLNDAAVLYRNNWQGYTISRSLEAKGIAPNRLKFMTIHSSKGLEFGSVIIAGVSDKIIPDASADIEEERRLLYVAMTRAKENLFIVHYSTAEGELSLFAKELGFSKR
ncbi:MAG: ATP-dependent helicase [Spirochaetota bacterium]